jgi:hypothetical protein
VLTILLTGEGHFDDKPSGTATPTMDETRKGKGQAKARTGVKKKTARQRLAIADGGDD